MKRQSSAKKSAKASAKPAAASPDAAMGTATAAGTVTAAGPSPSDRPGRLAQTFATCAAENRAAFIGYVMTGDPDYATSKAAALACLEGGADILELGIPFSDPIADGPTIQHAAERALAAGTRLEHCLRLARELRAKSDAPIVLMGCYNPIANMGDGRFLAAASEAGIDGTIIPDLPPEEAADYVSRARSVGIDSIFLLAPTSNSTRRKAAFALAGGFIYYVSVTGVTGARRALPTTLTTELDQLRRECPVPVVVGFGIHTAAQVHALSSHADGVAVGSAIVARLAEAGSRHVRADRVRKLVRKLSRATTLT